MDAPNSYLYRPKHQDNDTAISDSKKKLTNQKKKKIKTNLKFFDNSVNRKMGPIPKKQRDRLISIQLHELINQIQNRTIQFMFLNNWENILVFKFQVHGQRSVIFPIMAVKNS